MPDASSPHSSAGSFVATPNYDREVLQMTQAWRRGLRVFAFLIAFVLPALSLHYDPYGFDITCRTESKECTIDEHHLARDVTTTIPFSDIRVVQGHTEWISDDDGDRQQTGRFSLTFNTVDGRSIDASLNAYPDALPADALRAYLKDPVAPIFTVTTMAGLSDSFGILAFFLGGLLLVALTLWRTEVSLDHSTKLLRVSRQLWPLLRRTMLAAPIDDVKSVRTTTGEYLSTVLVTMQDGSEVRIARMLTSVSADAVTSAIKRKIG